MLNKASEYTKNMLHALKVSSVFHPSVEFLTSLGIVIVVWSGGKILFDGHDIHGVQLESLRSQIAMVLQDTFLFNGTVADNISYARPNASFEEIVEAAKSASPNQEI